MKNRKDENIETGYEIADMLNDIEGQKIIVLNQLRFPPFTMKKNATKTLKIFKAMEKIEAKARDLAVDGKMKSAKNSFAPLVADHPEMFKEANQWIKKSNNNPHDAAKMYMAMPDYQPGDLIPPLYQDVWMP
ncbi:MAG: hypothetical protein ACOVOP_03780 [Candidatus Planktophila sp.]|jgi:hypothetical protein